MNCLKRRVAFRALSCLVVFMGFGGGTASSHLQQSLAAPIPPPDSELSLSAGDVYAARRSAAEVAKRVDQPDAIRRWARLEDLYGNGGTEAYLALVRSLEKQKASQEDVAAACRRGLVVAIRGRQYNLAAEFANRLAATGDPAAHLFPVAVRHVTGASTTPLPGGVDSLYFLAVGKGKTNPQRCLLDYARALVRNGAQGKEASHELAEGIHRYFAEVDAVAALGSRTADGFAVELSLNGKSEQQVTTRVLRLLGLNLRTGNGRFAVDELEGRSQAGKQDTLAALALDDDAIQQALSTGTSYLLQIPVDNIRVFPSEEQWRMAFYEKQRWPGGLADALASDPRMWELYVALNSMDPSVAEALIGAVSLKTLATKYGPLLARCSSALAMSGRSAELPGGEAATPVWHRIAGADPADPARFFVALMNRDDGLLLDFFALLAQLDMPHQRFFTRSAARTQRFYELFLESRDTRHADLVGDGEFEELVAEVPLNDRDQLNLPGGPHVWIEANRVASFTASSTRIDKRVKSRTPPDSEDEILVRLLTPKNISGRLDYSEAAKFVATARMNAGRPLPLDPASVQSLVENYNRFGGSYPYFAVLTGLTASDYQSLFSLGSRLLKYDPVTTNLRAGQVNAFLELLCLAQQGGVATEQEAANMYRAGLRRYSSAGDPSDWALASLAALNDLSRLSALQPQQSHDVALRTLLLGKATSVQVSLLGGVSTVEPLKRRAIAFQQVLNMQKVPSLDALFSVHQALQQLQSGQASGASLATISESLDRIGEVPIPKTLPAGDSDRQLLSGFRKTGAERAFAKLRDGARKGNRADLEKAATALMAELEHMVALGMTGLVYARFLDPSDRVVSDDPLLLRKHTFVKLTRAVSPRAFEESSFDVQGDAAGSRFSGGFASFAMVSAYARAQGNHLGGANGRAMAAAIVASARTTDWRLYSEAGQLAFAGRVRLAQEWIVESAADPLLLNRLRTESRGLLSLARRKALLTGIESRDWIAVWEAVSISNLYFLGEALLEHAPAPEWATPDLSALRTAANRAGGLDSLGQLAPALTGSCRVSLRRFLPYEGYERYLFPARIAERSAELKLTLAWLADSAGWPPEVLAAVAGPAADLAVSKLAMRDSHDWRAAMDAFSKLRVEQLEALAADSQ